jgi:hypothetical protein
MSRSELDRDQAERMLRGEPAGPPRLAELLAAASSQFGVEELTGEDAAVTAFREARSLRALLPRSRRPVTLVSLKAVLIAFLLTLAGGVTAAAATHHLPGPLGDHHTPNTRTPATSRTFVTRVPPHPSFRLVPDRHNEHGKKPQETGRDKPHPPHPTKKPKSKPGKTKPHKSKGQAHPSAGQ